MKDHEFRELVNQLRDIAVEYRDTQQLREHIAHTVRAALQSGNSGQPVTVPAGYVLVPVEPTDLMVEAMYRHPLSMRGALKSAIAAAPKGGCEVETITFVVEFEDGKAPLIKAHMEVFGGKVVAVAFRDALSEEPEQQVITVDRKPLLPAKCAFCNSFHPIGVQCPMISITSAVTP